VKQWLAELASSKSSESQILVSQARHFELLSKIQLSLNSAAKLIKEDLSSEFVAQEMQIGIRAIHELLGKSFDEQVIDRIFKEFCLGK
jgi:tRNA modification GTPase